MMNDASGRRGFIRTVTIGGAGLALASKLPLLRQLGRRSRCWCLRSRRGLSTRW